MRTTYTLYELDRLLHVSTELDIVKNNNMKDESHSWLMFASIFSTIREYLGIIEAQQYFRAKFFYI